MQVKNKIQHYFKNRFFMDLDSLGRMLVFIGTAAFLIGIASCLFALAEPDSTVWISKILHLILGGCMFVLVGSVLLRYVTVRWEKKHSLYKNNKSTTIADIICRFSSIACIASFIGFILVLIATYVCSFYAANFAKEIFAKRNVFLYLCVTLGVISLVSAIVREKYRK